MFFKKGVLKLKSLSVLQSLFNKVSDLQVCSFIKKRLQHKCFPVNSANILGHLFPQNLPGRLLMRLRLMFPKSQIIFKANQIAGFCMTKIGVK